MRGNAWRQPWTAFLVLCILRMPLRESRARAHPEDAFGLAGPTATEAGKEDFSEALPALLQSLAVRDNLAPGLHNGSIDEDDRAVSGAPSSQANLPERPPLLAMPPRRLPRHDPFSVAPVVARRLAAAAAASADEASAGSAEAHFITPEIQALAEGLDNDPLLIFSYVQSHIEFEPTYGLLKVPRETLLSGVGSPIDQAALLVALLRAAGYQARYVYGLAILSFDQATNWTGAHDPEIAADVFSNGGINVRKGNNYVAILHVWATVKVGETWYPLDPSFKRYESSGGLELGSVLGYDRSAFLNAAQSGATVATDYVQNLNTGNIRGRLASYTRNLISYLDQNSPFATPADVIGQRRVAPENLTALPTELPYTVYGTPTEFDVIGEDFRYLIWFELPGDDYITELDVVSGERVTLFFEGATPADRAAIESAGGIYSVYPAYEVRVVPLLRLGGQVVATGSPVMLGETVPVTVTISAPWVDDEGELYFADSFEDYASAGESAAFVSRLQQTSAAQIDRRQELLAAAMASGLGDESEAVLGEGLTLIGLSYFHQISLLDALFSHMTGVCLIRHFSFAWITQGIAVEQGLVGGQQRPMQVSLGSPGVDISYRYTAGVARDGQDVREDVREFVDGSPSSALEHGVIEQLQDLAGVSTVQVLRLADEAGQKIYRLTPANVDTVLPLLQYSQASRDYLRGWVEDGFELLIPQGYVHYNQWTGGGWILRTEEGIPAGFLISGELAGGSGTEPRVVKLDGLMPDIWRVPLSGPIGDPNSSDPYNPRHVADPVDPASGAFLYSHRDLAFGSLGFPISFSRSYASSRHRSGGPLGPGWTHSYNMMLVESTDWTRGLGGGTAVDMASAIVYAYVSSDIGWMPATDVPWHRIVIGSEMAHWLMSQLTGNAVLVTDHRGAPHSYLLLPDGSYRGGPATYSTLASRPGGGYSLQGKDGSQFDFDAGGRLEALSDVNGNRTTLSRDTSGRLVRVTDPVGRVVELSYSANRLTRVVDPEGRENRYGYDASGRLTSHTDPAGHVTRYAYGGDDRLTSITDPEGHTFVQCDYDLLGRVVAQTNGLGGTVTIRYGGDRTVVTQPAGSRVVYRYDQRKRLVQVQDPLGNRRTTTYDGNDNPVSVADERGKVTGFTYDAHGNLTSVTDPLGQSTAYTYDAANNLIRVSDPLGHVWRYEYDGRHRLTRATDPLGHSSSYAYDARGQVTRVTDANGGSTILNYDASGSLTRITTAAGQATSMVYDALGRLTSVTDPNGGLTRYTYDAAGNLAQVTDPAGGVVSVEYDGNGSALRMTDPLGNVTRFDYDAQLNLTAITDPLGRAQSFQYDEAGNLVRRVKADGQQIAYVYDAAGRLLRAEYPDGTRATFAYDASGNVSRSTRGNWEETHTYDGAGRLVSVDYAAANVTLTYEYDAAGNRTSLTASRGAAVLAQWSYTYDSANRPTAVATGGNAAATRLEYDAVGNLTAVIHPSGARTNYGFDADGGVASAQALDGDGGPIVQWDYTRDAAGNPLTVRETRSGGSRTVSYSYDERGQLTAEVYPHYSISYQYDAAGNRTRMSGPWGTTLYTYDAAGQLLSAGSRSFTYDANGNLTQESGGGRTLTYVWDGEDRLSGLTLPGGITKRFDYDAFGRVIREDNDSTSHHLAYDGWLAVLESAEGFASGVAYTQVGGRLLSRVPLGKASSPGVSYHADGLGHIRLLTDQGGNPRDVYPSDAFGYPTMSSGLDPTPYRYAGEWGVRDLMSPVGLYRMGFRFYDASTGRFLSKDPLLGSSGAPLTVNAYIYALNSPLRYLDPMGLRAASQQRVDKTTRNMTQSILSWAIGDPSKFDPVEFALRLVFYREAAQQRIRELQAWVGNLDQAGTAGLPGPQTRPDGSSEMTRQQFDESISVLQGVMRQIDDVLSGRVSF